MQKMKVGLVKYSAQMQQQVSKMQEIINLAKRKATKLEKTLTKKEHEFEKIKLGVKEFQAAMSSRSKAGKEKLAQEVERRCIAELQLQKLASGAAVAEMAQQLQELAEATSELNAEKEALSAEMAEKETELDSLRLKAKKDEEETAKKVKQLEKTVEEVKAKEAKAESEAVAAAEITAAADSTAATLAVLDRDKRFTCAMQYTKLFIEAGYDDLDLLKDADVNNLKELFATSEEEYGVKVKPPHQKRILKVFEELSAQDQVEPAVDDAEEQAQKEAAHAEEVAKLKAEHSNALAGKEEEHTAAVAAKEAEHEAVLVWLVKAKDEAHSAAVAAAVDGLFQLLAEERLPQGSDALVALTSFLERQTGKTQSQLPEGETAAAAEAEAEAAAAAAEST
jgi:hypothetical protein